MTRNDYQSIALMAIKKYAQEHDGSQGWVKKDIEDEVHARGGDKKDLYSIMAIAMDILLENIGMQSEFLN